jgi:ubiquinone/menaquinone biosynthesis C-methylase UbiE
MSSPQTPAKRTPTYKEAAAAWTHVWGEALVSIQPGRPMYRLVQAWWEEQLRQFAPPSAVLEIGAGVSAQPARCAAALWPQALVVASDYRAVRLSEAAQPAGPALCQVAGAVIERLPFASGTIDVVLSQFAFEYAATPAALLELTRILRPGGAARLLVHHAGSLYAQYLEHRIACLGVGARLARAVFERGSSAKQWSARVTRNIQRVVRLAVLYADPTPYPKIAADLNDFLTIGRWATAHGRDARLDTNAAALLLECEPALHIAQAQQAAALSRQQLEALLDDCRRHGFLAEARTFGQAGATLPFCWAVRLDACAMPQSRP